MPIGRIGQNDLSSEELFQVSLEEKINIRSIHYLLLLRCF